MCEVWPGHLFVFSDIRDVCRHHSRSTSGCGLRVQSHAAAVMRASNTTVLLCCTEYDWTTEPQSLVCTNPSAFEASVPHVRFFSADLARREVVRTYLRRRFGGNQSRPGQTAVRGGDDHRLYLHHCAVDRNPDLLPAQQIRRRADPVCICLRLAATRWRVKDVCPPRPVPPLSPPPLLPQPLPYSPGWFWQRGLCTPDRTSDWTSTRCG